MEDKGPTNFIFYWRIFVITNVGTKEKWLEVKYLLWADFCYFRVRYNGEKLASLRQWRPVHFGSKQPNADTSKSSLSRELRSEWASKLMNASDHASKASRVEQANELVLQANEQKNEWMGKGPRTYVRIPGSSELI